MRHYPLYFYSNFFSWLLLQLPTHPFPPRPLQAAPQAKSNDSVNTASLGLSPLDELDPDVILDIVSWLPAHDASSMAAASVYCAATISCDFIWQGYLEEEQERHPEVLLPQIEGANVAQLYWAFRQAAEASLAREVLSVAEKYKQKACPFSALRRVVGDAGTLDGGGTPEARFMPDSPFDLPQPAVVALELVKFFDKVPRSEKGVVVGNKYERVAAVFGCSHQAVRDLERRTLVLRFKPLDQAQALAAPFPDASKQRRTVGGGKPLMLRLWKPPPPDHASDAKAAQRVLARLKPAHAQLETRYYQTVFQLAAARQQAQANARAASVLARAKAVCLTAAAKEAAESDQASATELRAAQRRLAASQKLAADAVGKRDRQAALIIRGRQQRDHACTEQRRAEAVMREMEAALLAAKQTIAAQKRKLAEQQQQIEMQVSVAGAAAGRICGQVDTPPHKKQLFFREVFFWRSKKKPRLAPQAIFSENKCLLFQFLMKNLALLEAPQMFPPHSI